MRALERGYEVDAVDTQRPRHATELSRDAARDGYDAVVALGGDGTINEAANGLAGTDTALACLPGGATNVYCRMIGISTDVARATEQLLARRGRLGAAPRRPRAASTTAGSPSLSARASTRRSSSASTPVSGFKARFGPWFYAQSALGTFLASLYVIDPPRVVAFGPPVVGR